MNYVSPEHVFAFLVNSYGTVAIFVYLLIAFAELRLRGQLERNAPETLREFGRSKSIRLPSGTAPVPRWSAVDDVLR